jgi:putative tricarboxylic transport membrane protein
MSDGTRSGATAAIQSPANFYGGVVMALMAVIALAVSLYHPGVGGFYGPVLMPRAFALVVLIAGLGAVSGQLVLRNPQDFFGGAALIGLAVLAMLASIDLPGMRGFAFGPGTAPRLFALLLASLAALVTFNGLIFNGPPLERFAIRGPVFLTAAVFCFSASIRPLGLVIASYLTILVSAGATPEVRWRESVIWGVVLSTFCAVLFTCPCGGIIPGLNLPMQLWPRF